MRTIEAISDRIPATLARAVVEQLGCDTDELETTLRDVTNHGADAGFGSFCYYSDTCKFFETHRVDIRKLVESTADELGEGAVELVRGFKCLRDMKPTESDVAHVLFGNDVVRDGDDNIDVQVANALAWFALEETARAMVDE